MDTVFFDGEFIPKAQACIPITDRGFLYGDGVFTTLRVSNGKIEFLEKHLFRLKQNCAKIDLKYPNIEPNWFVELVQRNQAEKGICRMKVIITGGSTPTLSLESRPYGHLIILLQEYVPPEEPFRLTVFPIPTTSFLPGIKSLAYLERLAIKQYATSRGFHDALTTTQEGILLEGSFSNIFWRQENTIYTPSRELPLLSGVYLSVVREKALSLGLQFQEVHVSVHEIPRETNVYLCNSLMGVHQVKSIDQSEYILDSEFREVFRY